MTEPDTAGREALPRAGRGGALVDWDAVEADYRHSGMSQARIADKHGTSEASLRKRRDAGGWERVAPLVRLPTRRRPPGDGLPPTPTELRRGRIVARLYNLLDAKMSEIETRMAETNGASKSAAEAEREARNLNALARLYAKLVEMDEAKAARGGKASHGDKAGSKTTTQDGADADRLRRDLAGRLARLKPGDD